MRARTAEKVLRNQPLLRRYGKDRATGSRKLRRGRRALLRLMPWLRDRSSLSLGRRLDLLQRDLDKLTEGVR